MNLDSNCREEKAHVIGIGELSEKKEQKTEALHKLLEGILIYRAEKERTVLVLTM